MMLTGKTALVTGASRGIGAAIARLLAQHGAAVSVNYVNNREAGEAVVQNITALGGKALLVQADVTDRNQSEHMILEVEQALGPIDILVLNAGFQFRIAPFLDFPWEDFEHKLAGELKAAFFCCRAVVPSMITRGSGSIIAISSTLSRHPGDGFCAHSTAKSALNAFVQSLAHELGPHGIRVNTVAPGLTLTDATAGIPGPQKQAIAAMTPLRRNGLPEDIAGPVLFLASDQSRFITGTYTPVDGGIQMT